LSLVHTFEATEQAARFQSVVRGANIDNIINNNH